MYAMRPKTSKRGVEFRRRASHVLSTRHSLALIGNTDEKNGWQNLQMHEWIRYDWGIFNVRWHGTKNRKIRTKTENKRKRFGSKMPSVKRGLREEVSLRFVNRIGF